MELIKDTINSAKLDAQNLENKTLAWDFIKCRIQTKSITFAIRKSKESNDQLIALSNRLRELEDLISMQPALNHLDELNRTKSAIESIYNNREEVV